MTLISSNLIVLEILPPQDYDKRSIFVAAIAAAASSCGFLVIQLLTSTRGLLSLSRKGQNDNSPAIYCWDRANRQLSPGGTAEGS